MNWPLHGSNPQSIYKILQLPMPDKIIDFSVNLNPFGPPPSLKQNWPNWFDRVEDYPDPNGNELMELISKKESLPKESILLGNGAAELIALLANMFTGKRVLLIQPTFSEYGRMCEAHGCHITNVVLTEGEWELPVDMLVSKLTDIDAVFLCHPNNPTGIVYPEKQLLQIAEACQNHNCFFVVDEAFYDFLDDQNTMAPFIETYTNLVVIRSLTKIYAIAGLRLGYVLAAPEVIKKLHRYQAHWSVNALALLAGEECLNTDHYMSQTSTLITSERKRLFHTLKQAGYVVSASKVNFYLLQDTQLDEQLPLFLFLLKKGIVPRHTVNYQGLEGRWLRFAVRKPFENDILLEALLEWKSKK